MRCRKCHLTMSKTDLGQGHCPECYETSGVRHSDFEPLAVVEKRKTRYRCDECGSLIEI